MVALCHWSLQNPFPAQRLVDLIGHLRAMGSAIPDADHLYDTLRDCCAAEYVQRIQGLSAVLDGFVSRNPAGRSAFGKLLSWYANDAHRHLRINVDKARRFPLDTFICRPSHRMGPANRVDGLMAFFREVSIPQLTDSHGRTWAFGGDPLGDEVIGFVRSLVDLVFNIWGGASPEWECPLYSSCELDFRGDACTRERWKNGQRSPTCPYGAAAQLLGVSRRDFDGPPQSGA
jgi:hypothetical protein